MNITIKKKEGRTWGVDSKGENLAIFKWSVEDKDPKEGEIWSCTACLYEPLELVEKRK